MIEEILRQFESLVRQRSISGNHISRSELRRIHQDILMLSDNHIDIRYLQMIIGRNDGGGYGDYGGGYERNPYTGEITREMGHRSTYFRDEYDRQGRGYRDRRFERGGAFYGNDGYKRSEPLSTLDRMVRSYQGTEYSMKEVLNKP